MNKKKKMKVSWVILITNINKSRDNGSKYNWMTILHTIVI